LKSMFSHLSREQMMDLIFPIQKKLTPIPSFTHADTPQISQRDTSSAYRGDHPNTPTQSPRVSPVPIDLMTPVHNPRSVSPAPAALNLHIPPGLPTIKFSTSTVPQSGPTPSVVPQSTPVQSAVPQQSPVPQSVPVQSVAPQFPALQQSAAP